MEAGVRTERRQDARARASQISALARDYLSLTKPKVQSLLLFTTVTTMYVAGTPSIGRVVLTCLGGALSAGGAGAINHYLDRVYSPDRVLYPMRRVGAKGEGRFERVSWGQALAPASLRPYRCPKTRRRHVQSR